MKKTKLPQGRNNGKGEGALGTQKKEKKKIGIAKGVQKKGGTQTGPKKNGKKSYGGANQKIGEWKKMGAG